VSPVIFNKLPAIAAAAKPLADQAVRTAAFATEGFAKNLAPVDTGNLRNTIAAGKERDLVYRVTAHADYAIYIEMGTRRRNGGARPFLEPALRQGEKHLTNALKAIL
jgi:HK97 gp10 family phage protein